MEFLWTNMTVEEAIFVFFFFSFFGWSFEVFLEILAGRGFVNRGFFYGPIVPIYAAGFFFTYFICNPLKFSPVLVFLASSSTCTALEYCIGVFLEKYLNVRAWDYNVHPFTFWCNYKRKISAVASLAFGFLALLTVYVLWDRLFYFVRNVVHTKIIIFNTVFVTGFLIDAFFSFRKYTKNKRAGILSITNGQDYEEDDEFFYSVANTILHNEKFMESKNFIQHGKTSVYEHSLYVAQISFKLSTFWKLEDKESLIRAALLHDFFLYDWHDEWNLDHGFTHPRVAAENAVKYFNISDKEYSLIRTHMWPFTLFHPPRYREGWVICLADKISSLTETSTGIMHRVLGKLQLRADNDSRM